MGGFESMRHKLWGHKTKTGVRSTGSNGELVVVPQMHKSADGGWGAASSMFVNGIYEHMLVIGSNAAPNMSETTFCGRRFTRCGPCRSSGFINCHIFLRETTASPVSIFPCNLLFQSVLPILPYQTQIFEVSDELCNIFHLTKFYIYLTDGIDDVDCFLLL